MFIAFCYSISIIALLNWILSLKFSNICSLIFLISEDSSKRPHWHTTAPYFLNVITGCIDSFSDTI